MLFGGRRVAANLDVTVRRRGGMRDACRLGVGLRDRGRHQAGQVPGTDRRSLPVVLTPAETDDGPAKVSSTTWPRKAAV